MRLTAVVMFVPVEPVPGDLIVNGDTITIALSMSDDQLRHVALEVRLSVMGWRGVTMHDISFLIVVLDAATGSAEEIYDRDKAAEYVKPVKDLVMDCVCKAAQALVRSVQPDVIHMVTCTTRPPEKSLFKYRMITDTLENEGFEVIQSDVDPYDRRFWIMAKVGDA